MKEEREPCLNGKVDLTSWGRPEAGEVKDSPDELSSIPTPATAASSCNPSGRVACI